jgi:hypothetical protein
MPSVNFSFYGIGLQLNTDNDAIRRDVERDFSFFLSGVTQPRITLNVFLSPPPYETLPPLVAAYVSPRNICYLDKEIKYIDYAGKGLVICNKKKLRYDIYSADYPLLYEACYMAILSVVSEQLDKAHIHRVHGLGLARDNKAIIILLDMGGGKTTLALHLLSSGENIRLISEDSPLIDSRGQILSFPIRIGVRPDEVPPTIPKEYQRYFEREEFGPKVLIDIDYFKGKICNNLCHPEIVIIGRRVLGRGPEIKPSSKYAALKEFIKNSVIGFGLYQGIEYIFQKGTKEIFLKIPLGLSRLGNALRVIAKSKIFVFYLSSDKEVNASTLLSFLMKHKEKP